MTWRHGMKTPLMIDTMNKRCYDIIPPTAKKMEVLYAPTLEIVSPVSGIINGMSYVPAVTPDIKTVTLGQTFPFLYTFVGGTGYSNNIYLTSDPPIPVGKLGSYAGEQVEIRYTGANPPYNIFYTTPYIIGGKTYYLGLFIRQTGTGTIATISIEHYFITIEDGNLYSKIVASEFSTAPLNPQVAQTSQIPAVAVSINGSLYIIQQIAIAVTSTTPPVPAIIVSGIDVSSMEVLSSRLYIGVLMGIDGENNRVYVSLPPTSPTTTWDISVFGVDTSTGGLYGITTLSLQINPQQYMPIYFDGEIAGIVPYVSSITPGALYGLITCSVGENNVTCYDAGFPTYSFQIKYGDMFYASSFSGTTVSYGLIYDDKIYGVTGSSPEYSIFPFILLYDKDALVYSVDGVYLYMSEIMPWSKCCDIQYTGYTCMSGDVSVSAIDIPITDTGVTPTANELPLIGISTVTSPIISPTVISKTVPIDRVC